MAESLFAPLDTALRPDAMRSFRWGPTRGCALYPARHEPTTQSTKETTQHGATVSQRQVWAH